MRSTTAENLNGKLICLQLNCLLNKGATLPHLNCYMKSSAAWMVRVLPTRPIWTVTQVLKNEGDTVLSQEVLAVFEEGAAAAAPAPAAEAPAAAPAPVAAAPAAAGPAARKAAAEAGVDIAAVAGSGAGGRVTLSPCRLSTCASSTSSAGSAGAAVSAPPSVSAIPIKRIT